VNKILCGDCVTVLSDLPPDSVDLVVTSPPYDDIRFYADGFTEEFDKSPADFASESDYKKELQRFKKQKVAEKLEINNGYSFPFEAIARQLYRAIKPGGTVVWIVGDAVVNKSETGSSFRQALYFKEIGFNLHDTMIYEKNGSSFPARHAGNRYSQIFEYAFVFTKGDSPRHASLICDKPNRWAGYTTFGKGTLRDKSGELKEKSQKPIPDFSPRNNIWKYNTGKGFSTKDVEAFNHPAIFPEKLAEDHILSWSSEGDVVLDPFCGSGTTCKMALLNNRCFIGVDISEEYCELSRNRVEKAVREGRTAEIETLEKEISSLQKKEDAVRGILEGDDSRMIDCLASGIILGTLVDYVPNAKRNKGEDKSVAILSKVASLLEKKKNLNKSLKEGIEETEKKREEK